MLLCIDVLSQCIGILCVYKCRSDVCCIGYVPCVYWVRKVCEYVVIH